MTRHLHRALVLIALALLGAASAVAEPVVIHVEKSQFDDVVVYENDGERCMKFGGPQALGRQTCLTLAQPATLLLNYTRMMMAALYLKPDPRNILIIGLGGGSLPKALASVLPQTRIDVVEIDPAVAAVARRYFSFRPGALMRVHIDDGRRFVQRAAARGQKYDIVMLDAFDETYVPAHLMTREFLREVRAILRDDGVIAANTFTSSRLYEQESATYADVFGPFYNLRTGNRVILGRKRGLPSSSQLRQRAQALHARLAPLGVDGEQLLPLFSTRQDWPDSARVLTDPVQ